MKVSELKKIIKEEIQSVLRETKEFDIHVATEMFNELSSVEHNGDGLFLDDEDKLYDDKMYILKDLQDYGFVEYDDSDPEYSDGHRYQWWWFNDKGQENIKSAEDFYREWVRPLLSPSRDYAGEAERSVFGSGQGV